LFEMTVTLDVTIFKIFLVALYAKINNKHVPINMVNEAAEICPNIRPFHLAKFFSAISIILSNA
ncbi:15776_t:CDS:1, partial [Gigaspora rosea]